MLAKGGGREEAAPVSCWRTLLVANEWAELQAARLTYPPLTLAFVALLMDGAGFAAAAQMAPGSGGGGGHLNAPRPGVATSMLLRFGVAAGWFLVAGAAQWLWKALVAHRLFGHPLANFVDLLFLANTSAVVLDDRSGGYYLHGRNQMRHADTSLPELNAALMREEDGLVARRGLVTAYAGAGAARLNDGQAFALHIPSALRRAYEATLLAQVEQAAMDQRLARGAVTSALRGPLRPRDGALAAARQIGLAFAAAVDEAECNHGLQVIVPTYWQRALRLPPPEAALGDGGGMGGGGMGMGGGGMGGGGGLGGRTLLVHDFDDAWASVLLYGREARLFAFEALLFCAVDSAARSATVAAFVVLATWLALRALRLHFGRNNLGKKTLVDRRFLI